MSKIIVLMGAPGAGKGTQARLLQERLGLPHISTGDILRALATEQTPLAREVKAVQSAGGLISDDLVIRIVSERTRRPDCLGGYVLDGFPRTTVQAAMLETLGREQGHTIQAVVIDVPAEVLQRRTAGRRSCPVCGEIYNIYFKPPKVDELCDLHPDVALVRRTDDQADKVLVRLATYERETRPLLDYYEASHRLARVDGLADTEEIYNKLRSIITGEI